MSRMARLSSRDSLGTSCAASTRGRLNSICEGARMGPVRLRLPTYGGSQAPEAGQLKSLPLTQSICWTSNLEVEVRNGPVCSWLEHLTPSLREDRQSTPRRRLLSGLSAGASDCSSPGPKGLRLSGLARPREATCRGSRGVEFGIIPTPRLAPVVPHDQAGKAGPTPRNWESVLGGGGIEGRAPYGPISVSP